MDETPNSDRRTRRHTLACRISWLVIICSLLIIGRQLPVREQAIAFARYAENLGITGLAAFGVIYVIAVVLMVPASIMTVAAAAVFGFLPTLITVSLASTTGAALAFLISRYLARDAVSRMFMQHPKLRAVETAIAEGGWKVVALLRLSPVIPFNLQNYLYGLTPIPFRTCILTSWVSMLPGTALYVYLGHAGRAGLEAFGGETGRTPAEWAVTVIGLTATIVVTVYVSRLAARALEQQRAVSTAAANLTEPEREQHPVRTAVLVVSAIVSAAAAAVLCVW